MSNVTAAMFASAANATARSMLALYALAVAGFAKGPSVTWVALARWECAGWWLQPRTGVLEGMYDTDCWSSRTCVGLETGRDEFGAPTLQSAVARDPVVLTALRDLGLVTPKTTTTSTYYVWSPQVVNSPNGESIAGLLEAVIWDRNRAGLMMFSLGPTQLWMAQTPMYQEYASELIASGVSSSSAKLGSALVPGFPQSWEDLFRLYTADSVEEVAHFLALAYPTKSWPGDAPYDRDRAVTFLARYQTGGAPPYDRAQEYADQHFMSNVQYYAAQWDSVQAGTNTYVADLGLPQLPEIAGATAYLSNPGPVGQDTGYTFRSPRTGTDIRVIAKQGEERSEAIRRVRAKHGL